MKKSIVLLIHVLLISITSQAQKWSYLGSNNTAIGIGFNLKLAVDHSGKVYAAGDLAGNYPTNTIHSNYFVALWNGAQWNEVGIGNNALNANGTIETIVTDEAGNVYVGGFFTNASNKYYVAKWDGTSWSELGGPNSLNADGEIMALHIDKSGNLYAAGAFTDNSAISGYSSSNVVVAKWDGTAWATVGQKFSAAWKIKTIATDNAEHVYASGEIFWVDVWRGDNDWLTDEENQYSIGRTNWHTLGGNTPGSFFANAYILSIATDNNSNVYAGGYFKYGNQFDFNFINKWNGTSWNKLDAPNTDFFAAIGSKNIMSVKSDASNNIFVGGNYDMNARDNPYAAKWDGNNWAKLETSKSVLVADGELTSMVMDVDGNVYIAGGSYFSPSQKFYVAKWTADTTAIPTINNSTSTGILSAASNSALKFTVWPNPGNNNITASFPENGDLYISNLLGEQIATIKVSEGDNSINTEAFISGIYTISFKSTSAYYVPVKWIKE